MRRACSTHCSMGLFPQAERKYGSGRRRSGSPRDEREREFAWVAVWFSKIPQMGAWWRPDPDDPACNQLRQNHRIAVQHFLESGLGSR